MQCSQFLFVFMYVYMYVYLHHTLISIGSWVADAYWHDVHMVTLTLMNASAVWIMEAEKGHPFCHSTLLPFCHSAILLFSTILFMVATSSCYTTVVILGSLWQLILQVICMLDKTFIGNVHRLDSTKLSSYWTPFSSVSSEACVQVHVATFEGQKALKSSIYSS